MSRRYYTQPPTFGNIPAFLKKAYMDRYMRSLIRWAKQEYEMALQHLSRHATAKTIRFFLEEYSAMRVLAESEAFQEAIEFINEQNYNKLEGREKVFVRRSYELLRSLS